MYWPIGFGLDPELRIGAEDPQRILS